MLHGQGEQNFLTKDTEEHRRKALVDASKYTQTQLNEWGVYPTSGQGGGMTDNDTYVVESHPFPIKQKIRKKQKFDFRKEMPWIG